MRTRLLTLLAALAVVLLAAPADGARRDRCAGAAKPRAAAGKTRCALLGTVRSRRAGARWAAVRPPVFAPPPPAAPAPAPAPAPAAPADDPAGPGGDAPPPPPPPPPPAPDSDPRRLQVRADEFTLVRSQPEVAAGDVTVELSTVGAEDPHDLLIAREDGKGTPYRFDALGPGQTRSAVVAFAPGTYRLICTLPEHEARGMRATVTAR